MRKIAVIDIDGVLNSERWLADTPPSERPHVALKLSTSKSTASKGAATRSANGSLTSAKGPGTRRSGCAIQRPSRSTTNPPAIAASTTSTSSPPVVLRHHGRLASRRPSVISCSST